GKGEIGRPETHRQIAAEECLEELVDGAAQVGKADVPVDYQPLELVKHGGVGEVRIAPIDAPGTDDPQRWGAPLQGADLHRRGVGAQDVSGGDVEGVVHRPRGVMRGNVERLEVVIIVLDLRALFYPVAGADENRLDALQ